MTLSNQSGVAAAENIPIFHDSGTEAKSLE